MGTCVSVQKDSEALFRFRLGSGGSSKEGRLFAGPIPQENGGDDPMVGFEHGSKPIISELALKCASFESKDEAFFDSRAWLDSDCEDDFFSVNGDFIPSGNSTPNFQIGTPKTPRLSKTLINTAPDTGSEPSPRKKFAELLLETKAAEELEEQTVNGKADGRIEVNGKSGSPTDANLPQKTNDTAPYISGTNSSGGSGERTPNGKNTTYGKQKTKTMHCCLPGVVPTFTLHDKKKQRLSPQLQNATPCHSS